MRSPGCCHLFIVWCAFAETPRRGGSSAIVHTSNVQRHRKGGREEALPGLDGGREEAFPDFEGGREGEREGGRLCIMHIRDLSLCRLIPFMQVLQFVGLARPQSMSLCRLCKPIGMRRHDLLHCRHEAMAQREVQLHAIYMVLNCVALRCRFHVLRQRSRCIPCGAESWTSRLRISSVIYARILSSAAPSSVIM